VRCRISYFYRNCPVMKKSSLTLLFVSLAVLLIAQDKQEALASGAATMIEQKCFTCHSPTADHDNRLGPPMAAVKMHYTGKYDNKTDFVNAVTAYAMNPSVDKSLMPGAVRNFKLMPKQEFNEDEVRLIAAFIYENDLQTPDWFAEHHPNGMQHGKGKGMGMKHGKKEGQTGCAGCASGQCGHHGSH
jgi:mono/diheme cytochrome c family protein